MKPFAIALLIAAFAGGFFLYQVSQISHLDEEAAVLATKINQLKNPPAGTFVRSFFDGLTLGVFADEGIFSEAKKMEREETQLKAAAASLQSRYRNTSFFRNVGLFITVVAGVIGILLLPKKQKGI